MIITRAPLRITFGGGGTDLPSYYSKYGGQLISAGIDKYIYIALHEIFLNEFIIKYSQYERVSDIDSIKHPIIREALKIHALKPCLELVSFADIPDGTGLGSSSAFTVALLKAISFYKRHRTLTRDLAEEACDIEINRLGEPIGKQDQYASAYGGITSFTFHKDGYVEVSPLSLSPETIHDLEDNLLLFFTGFNRRASSVLSEQKAKTESLDQDMIENLHFTKDLGISSKAALEHGNLKEFAHLMNVHWENKKKRSQTMSNPVIDQAYYTALENGAYGGKLIGAGAGGFLMFYAKDRALLRTAMAKLNLREVRFKFDFEGAKAVSL